VTKGWVFFAFAHLWYAQKGHKEGGALAMKVYGHLRDQHSVEMAQKVTFSKPQKDKQDAKAAT
jgi:hypothetical protein